MKELTNPTPSPKLDSEALFTLAQKLFELAEFMRKMERADVGYQTAGGGTVDVANDFRDNSTLFTVDMHLKVKVPHTSKAVG